jgi:uncharacterized membrane protein YkoI
LPGLKKAIAPVDSARRAALDFPRNGPCPVVRASVFQCPEGASFVQFVPDKGASPGSRNVLHSQTGEENLMSGIRCGLALLIGTSVILLAALARADDKKSEKIAPDKLPKKIMDAVKTRFPNAEITSAEKENEGGKVVYDIELTHKGRKYEMDIQEDGTVIEIEKQVDAKDLPEAVGKALKAKFPDATIKEIMEVNKVKGKDEKPDHYEVVLVTKDKKEMEVVVSLDGKSIKGEKDEKEKK